MRNRSQSVRQALAVMVVATVVGAAGCRSRAQVTSEVVNAQALRHLKTFAVSAPAPGVAKVEVEVTATNGTGRAGGAVMDMNPMLATSRVGRAMREDLVSAFTHRGYRRADRAPDFDVHYYAGTGRVVDTRASESRYRMNGDKITTRTYEYPAGTVVVDVVDARSDSLVWRGTAIAQIPNNAHDYARTIRRTVDRVVAQFPRAKR